MEAERWPVLCQRLLGGLFQFLWDAALHNQAYSGSNPVRLRLYRFKDDTGQIATRDLRKWLKRLGLTYHSPHKFRHGHAVYALKMAKDVSALKVVSQNLMHENLSITDGVYGILSETDVRQQMATLGNVVANSEDVQELRLLVSRLLVRLEKAGS